MRAKLSVCIAVSMATVSYLVSATGVCDVAKCRSVITESYFETGDPLWVRYMASALGYDSSEMLRSAEVHLDPLACRP